VCSLFGDSNNRGNSNNNSNRRIRPEDPCPLPGHGSHIWYDCHANGQGKHGDNSRRPAGSNGTENHAIESDNAEQHFVDAQSPLMCQPCDTTADAGAFSYLFDDEPECFLAEVSEVSDDEVPDDEVPTVEAPDPISADDVAARNRALRDVPSRRPVSRIDFDTNAIDMSHSWHPNVYAGIPRKEWEEHRKKFDSKPAAKKPKSDGDSKPAAKEPESDGDSKPAAKKPKSDGDSKPAAKEPESDGDSKPAAKKPKSDGDSKPAASPKETDTQSVKSGPLSMSEGAFEMFHLNALLNEGVDDVISPVPAIGLNLVPTTLASARKVNSIDHSAPLKTLIDHGASHSIINKRCLPKRAEPKSTESISFSTTGGSFDSSSYILMEDFRLPEFNRNRSVDCVRAAVFDNPSIKYDLILGRDFLNKVGIDVKSSNLTCEWCGDSIPFKLPSYITNDFAHQAFIESQTEPSAVVDHEVHAAFTATKPTFADVEDVVRDQVHLTDDQRSQLLELLSKHTALFSGKLGCYPKRKFHIDLKPGTTPYHCKAPYPVPNSLRKVVKDEIDRQVQLDILERVNESLWGMPMLFVPKKDGAIRTVDDMRKLNECIQRRVYPLPKLQDMLRRHHNWRFVTVVDLTLCYYSYELDEESSWYCVLVTPFGKYRRKRLSMGCSQSSDWAQASLEEVLQQELYDFVEAFIDDVAVFSETWDEHIKQLAVVLSKLEANGYTVNPAKCHWGVQEVEWMGHLVTVDGLKPWPQKVEGILNIAPPQTLRQLRAFIGMVNFYRDFWKKRAHVMAPLTALTKVPRKEFLKHWSDDAAAAFKVSSSPVPHDLQDSMTDRG